MDPRYRLTRALVLTILVAAVASAPVFLFAEEFDREHILRVAASNGACALLCLFLLGLLRAGNVVLTARLLVFSLLALIGALAWTNGEPVHVNVINFVLVTLLAAVLLGRRGLLAVGAIAAALMVAIAWKSAVPVPDEDLLEVRLEAIVQFLPTYLVVIGVLWLREAPRTSD